MSQSPAFDAMQIARDALHLDGEIAFDDACQIVEDLGGWEFECWPRRDGSALFTLSYIYKHHYPVELIESWTTRPHAVLTSRNYGK